MSKGPSTFYQETQNTVSHFTDDFTIHIWYQAVEELQLGVMSVGKTMG